MRREKRFKTVKKKQKIKNTKILKTEKYI